MFLILGIILLATAFFFQRSAYEIQLSDTYFIISWGYILGYLGVFCCLVEIGYYSFNRKEKPSRSVFKQIHCIGTVVSIGLLCYSQAGFLALSGDTISNFETFSRAANLGVASILLFVIVQLIFAVFIIASVVRKS